MININEDIWEKHAFSVRDFFTFWRTIEVKLKPWWIINIHGHKGLTIYYVMVSYLLQLIAIAWHHSALKLPHKRKLANFEVQKHPLKRVSR